MQTSRRLFQGMLLTSLLGCASLTGKAQTLNAIPGEAGYPRAVAGLIPVEVIDGSEGLVGARLVDQVRASFRLSSSFRLTSSGEERLQVYVTTMPRFADDPNQSTMYTVVWVMHLWVNNEWVSVYLNHTLGYAGSNVVASSANSIVDKTDKLMDVIRLLYAAGY